ncbi:MAG: alpha/beta fold hydrolase [Pseudobdellovibrionaceae bacterium]
MSFLTKMAGILLAVVGFVAIASASAPKDPSWERKEYSVSDQQYKGFITVRPGRDLFVDLVKAAPGNPTVFLLNGLTYSTEQWNDFIPFLLKNKIGVVRIDLFGMGQSLIMKSGPPLSAISYQDQVEDLKGLMDVLKIKGPHNLLGLSYGGAIAMAFVKQYPSLVNKLILMAPFTKPVGAQDTWIRSQIWFVRKTNPMNPFSDDDLYDYYLRQIVYSTYPSAEPVILSHPYKLEGVYRLVQGVRKFLASEAVGSFPVKSVHLVLAARDQYIEPSVFSEFWNSVPAESRSSLLVINDSEHKIPQNVPDFSAGWVYNILMNHRLLNQGLDFIGDPKTGAVYQNGEKVIDLPKGIKYGYL